MNLPSLLPYLLRRSSKAATFLGSITLLMLLAPPTVKAASTTWSGSSGQWNTEASWNNGQPTITGTAVINNGSTVSTPTSITGYYKELLTGLTDEGRGVLNINGGLLSGNAASLGYAAGGSGSATVTGGTWNNTYDLYVGRSGTGTLAVNGGLLSGSAASLGYAAGGTGSATITSGTWRNITLNVGYSGTGTLAVNGGLLSGYIASLGHAADGTGSATITSGTWNSTYDLYVGYSGTGTLAVNGGLLSGSTASLGHAKGGTGNATVTSGTWRNISSLTVGNSGTGTLAVNGGTVVVSGTAFSGRYANGNGSITLSGNEEQRGVLETRALAKGNSSSSIGTGKVSFDGGVIRALAKTGNFFLRYEAGDITINSGGAFVDTNGVTIGITVPLAGEGALHKLGLGTLTLGGSNAYSGGTVVEAGTLTAAHQYGLGTGTVTIKSGGAFTIQSGVTVANAIVLEGGSLNKAVANGASLTSAVNISTTLGGATSAQLLDGTASDVTTLQTSFAATSDAENDDKRLGGVLHLSGVHVINISTGETDQFVLQLQVAGVTTETFLGWLDTRTNQWVNAVEGNIGGTANFLGNKAYNAATDFQLGNYGVDTVNGTVWAVLNHNSEFAVVPEPGTWALLVLGAGAVLHRTRKRRTI